MAEAPPAVMTYVSVVLQESVQIALTIATLNDLDIKASDVMDAYLTAPYEERVWTILGAELVVMLARKQSLCKHGMA
jgi:hypothetical protein